LCTRRPQLEAPGPQKWSFHAQGEQQRLV
jgi:hypothetical protein